MRAAAWIIAGIYSVSISAAALMFAANPGALL